MRLNAFHKSTMFEKRIQEPFLSYLVPFEIVEHKSILFESIITSIKTLYIYNNIA